MVPFGDGGWLAPHNHRPWLYALVTAVLVSACLLSIAFFDIEIARFFKSIETTPLVRIAAAVTNVAKGGPYLVISALLFGLFHFYLRDRLRANQALFVFAAVAVSGVLADLLKVLLGRARPKLLFHDNVYGFAFLHLRSEMQSFPSGHATTAAALAVALAILFPRYRVAFLIIGLLLAATRVIVAAHFLSDVLFSLVLGSLTVLVLKTQFERRGLTIRGALAA